jgi:radical SAM protein with 4Fe4S-binding SPASM domain
MLNLLLGKLPSYTRKARHIDQLLRHSGTQKLFNVAKSELSRVRGDIVLNSRPYIYTIDTGNACNLRCPLCPTGYHGLERPTSLMNLAQFETIIEKIRPYAVEVILHNWGEPFLNPDILKMIRHARTNGIGTTLSSNLNLVNRGERFLEEVVESGLEHLTVSIDGTTQEVYEMYRKGGHLDRVLANLRHLLDYRNRTGRSEPVVEWQYLVMKHNQHQMEDARRMAKEIGADRIRFTGAGLPFKEMSNAKMARDWLSDMPQYRGYSPEGFAERGYLYDEKCFYLYRAMTVNPQGEVSPCCAVYEQNADFGNLLKSGLDEVWNNEHYRASRALFSRKAAGTELQTICHRCPLFRYEKNRPAPSAVN